MQWKQGIFPARSAVFSERWLMKKRAHIRTGRVLIAIAAAAVLGGCAVVPYDSGYYGPGYVEPTVYVAPAVSFGFYGSSHGYYGHRHRYGRGAHHWGGRGHGGHRGGHHGRH